MNELLTTEELSEKIKNQHGNNKKLYMSEENSLYKDWC